MLVAHVTVAGTVPQLEKWYPVSAVAVTVVALSHSPIVNTFSAVLSLVPYGTSATELSSTVP
jgi:hypothetical protein